MLLYHIPLSTCLPVLLFYTLLQGGGWCNTIRSCVFRKTTRRGSSKYMEKQLAFTGILSNKAEENPGFSLYLTHACFNYFWFWRLQDMLTQILCVLIFCIYFLVCTDFFNWNRVIVRYCDGASFSGDSQNEVSESMAV